MQNLLLQITCIFQWFFTNTSPEKDLYNFETAKPYPNNTSMVLLMPLKASFDTTSVVLDHKPIQQVLYKGCYAKVLRIEYPFSDPLPKDSIVFIENMVYAEKDNLSKDDFRIVCAIQQYEKDAYKFSNIASLGYHVEDENDDSSFSSACEPYCWNELAWKEKIPAYHHYLQWKNNQNTGESSFLYLDYRVEARFKNKKLHGEYKVYTPENKLTWIASFKQGKINGACYFYHNNNDCSLLENKLWCPISIFYFKNGRLIEEKTKSGFAESIISRR